MDSTTQSSGAGEEEDLTGVQWNDKVWLTHFPLNATTALDYFALSQFYNRNCNNELIRMQRLDPALLKTMAGLEYGLEPCAPDATVFVITKRRRTINPPSLITLATYYIIDGSVYQAPCAHVVLANRTTQALHYLRSAFSSVQNAAKLTPHGTHRWDPPPKAMRSAADHLSAGVTRGEHSAMNAVLYDVLEKNRHIQDTRRKAEADEAAAAASAATGQAYGAEGATGSAI